MEELSKPRPRPRFIPTPPKRERRTGPGRLRPFPMTKVRTVTKRGDSLQVTIPKIVVQLQGLKPKQRLPVIIYPHQLVIPFPPKEDFIPTAQPGGVQ